MSSAEPAASELSEALLAALCEAVTAHLGLRCSSASWKPLTRGLEELSRQTGFVDPTECARWLLAAPPTQEHLEIVGHHLLIGESYFFREPVAFEILRRQIFPELLGRPTASGEGRRNLRIWSAGCATGEEPYSIAILLDQIVPDAAERGVTLLGTDIRSDLLAIAAKGVYRDWSFRGVPPGIKERYFQPLGRDCYELNPHIRERVTFAPLCLATDAYPSTLIGANALDLILCRNVLMYLETGHARRVVQRFADALVDGGWLIVGVTETSLPLFDGFEIVRRAGAAFYRKRSQSTTEQLSLPHRLPPRPAAGRGPTVQRSKRSAPAAPPRSAAEWHRIASSLARSGRVDDAIDAAAEGLREWPHDAAVLVLSAQLHANRGALDIALDYARRAVAAGKSDAGAHYQHACILNEMNRRSEAAAALRRVAYLAPEFALAHYMLGAIAHADGEVAAANRHLDNALAILERQNPDEMMHEAEGLTVGSLVAIVHSLRDSAVGEDAATIDVPIRGAMRNFLGPV